MNDLQIAQASQMELIKLIASKINIAEDDLIPYGKFIAKIPLKYINEEKSKQSKLILVTATSPTPAGEGKTTTSIGLADGLRAIGKNAMAVLREPSLGPVFGMKGGATGGGYAQVLPMEEINLHFTGDFSAIEKAHNLLSALVDNACQNKKSNIKLDPESIVWKRVMDMNDRSLRKIIISLQGNGKVRESGFDITAASEVMAILCLSNNINDLKQRLGNIYIGKDIDGIPIFAKDLKANGAMAILLKQAILPNLCQTIEGTPTLIHGGPFANIAQGTNTLMATKMGLSLSDYVVTEAGFGFDLGGEKFLDIKCRAGELKPSIVVLVTTLKSIKYHGGMPLTDVKTPSIDFLQFGIGNLLQHISNIKKFGIPCVVALNHFNFDTDEEIQYIKSELLKIGVKLSICKHWAIGSKGTEDLAHQVLETIEEQKSEFNYLYPLEGVSYEEKISTICKEIYGAEGITLTPKAILDLKRIRKIAGENLAICMAKTQYSFTDDATKITHQKGFKINIREIELANGAGFIIPIAGEMMRMPGLPAIPAAEGMDINADGIISGLS